MATDTCTHRKIDGALSHGCFCHVAMARRAGDMGLVMGRMAKPDMRIAGETVYSLPGNFLLLVGIFDYFLYFWLFTRELGMT
jgi:hypothetical protein